MSNDITIALKLLQMISLAIPPVAVLVKMLRKAENISWQTRQFSFALAGGSIVMFLCGEAAVLVFFYQQVELSPIIQIAMVFIMLALVPFALFMFVLYREQQLNFA
ncbi:hypothetical protein [Halocalculus aciditolerans]|uniref:Uncharacterized protein n=1 Tax=Halocalculus aciditolerans TaxID=1383812 RepID=A0A830FCM5_9EURY|nr:hypothetical protein [Halocalculus aciditolerans]GGL61673.1 hypothetical protein GCM10009039_19840 [Halocalculus aciditolerans]